MSGALQFGRINWRGGKSVNLTFPLPEASEFINWVKMSIHSPLECRLLFIKDWWHTCYFEPAFPWSKHHQRLRDEHPIWKQIKISSVAHEGYCDRLALWPLVDWIFFANILITKILGYFGMHYQNSQNGPTIMFFPSFSANQIRMQDAALMQRLHKLA